MTRRCGPVFEDSEQPPGAPAAAKSVDISPADRDYIGAEYRRHASGYVSPPFVNEQKN